LHDPEILAMMHEIETRPAPVTCGERRKKPVETFCT
jgi:hypothetical protein